MSITSAYPACLSGFQVLVQRSNLLKVSKTTSWSSWSALKSHGKHSRSNIPNTCWETQAKPSSISLDIISEKCLLSNFLRTNIRLSNIRPRLYEQSWFWFSAAVTNSSHHESLPLFTADNSSSVSVSHAVRSSFSNSLEISTSSFPSINQSV